jgi:TIR domain
MNALRSGAMRNGTPSVIIDSSGLKKGLLLATLFFSYSHADEVLRDRLEKHLSAVKRLGTISMWHDRRIIVGTEFDNAIDSHLNSADVILLLVSPDFIASEYCYEREMSRALRRHSAGEARVIPVILHPCDWHDLPFGKLLAAPTDGRPISKWPNIDEAFLNVVNSIKTALRELGHPSATKSIPTKLESNPKEALAHTQDRIRTSNLRIRKTFSDLDRDNFRHEGFEYIAKFFENSLQEMIGRNPDMERRFRRIDASRFAAALYRAGKKVCMGSVSVGGGSFGNNSIEYAMTDDPQSGGMNEAVYVKNDDQSMYFEPLGMRSYGAKQDKLSFEGVAELFWEIVIRPLQ